MTLAYRKRLEELLAAGVPLQAVATTEYLFPETRPDALIIHGVFDHVAGLVEHPSDALSVPATQVCECVTFSSSQWTGITLGNRFLAAARLVAQQLPSAPSAVWRDLVEVQTTFTGLYLDRHQFLGPWRSALIDLLQALSSRSATLASELRTDAARSVLLGHLGLPSGGHVVGAVIESSIDSLAHSETPATSSYQDLAACTSAHVVSADPYVGIVPTVLAEALDEFFPGAIRQRYEVEGTTIERAVLAEIFTTLWKDSQFNTDHFSRAAQAAALLADQPCADQSDPVRSTVDELSLISAEGSW